MKVCSNCRTILPDEAEFCIKCGEKQAVFDGSTYSIPEEQPKKKSKKALIIVLCVLGGIIITAGMFFGIYALTKNIIENTFYYDDYYYDEYYDDMDMEYTVKSEDFPEVDRNEFDISEIQLGMTSEEVSNILGEPSYIYYNNYEYEDCIININDVSLIGLDLYFDEETDELVDIGYAFSEASAIRDTKDLNAAVTEICNHLFEDDTDIDITLSDDFSSSYKEISINSIEELPIDFLIESCDKSLNVDIVSDNACFGFYKYDGEYYIYLNVFTENYYY